MADITFTIPSVLNQSNDSGEKNIKITAELIQDAFVKVSDIMGSDFKNKVLESDGTPRTLINIYINGKNVKFIDGLQTKLSDGDQVYILPAVAGGSNLHDDEEELTPKHKNKFSRQIMLNNIGYIGQIKLKHAKVCIVGAGGLGNPIITRLAAMGVGTLRIIDRDVIEISNLPRQIMFSEKDIGRVKVEVAAKKLQELNPDCVIEALSISVNDNNALNVIEGCDIIIDALDSVNARYALNKACIKLGIPFVTGAAVGMSGQVFTILPGTSACYYCMFPSLNERSMPTCGTEGVHPSILSIVAGIQVSEAVKIIIGATPSLAQQILHVDLENLDFNKTKTFRVEECPVCGTGKNIVNNTTSTKSNIVLEELCGRDKGKKTFAITPELCTLDLHYISNVAKAKGFVIDKQSEFGLSLKANDLLINIMKKGSAVIVGSKDENEAIELYNSLVKSC